MFPIFLEKRAGSAATPFIKQSWAKFLGVMNSIVEKMEKEQHSWFCHDLCVWPLRESGCIACVTCIRDDLCVTFTTVKWRLSAKDILWPLPVKTRCDFFLPMNTTSSLKNKLHFPVTFFFLYIIYFYDYVHIMKIVTAFLLWISAWKYPPLAALNVIYGCPSAFSLRRLPVL